MSVILCSATEFISPFCVNCLSHQCGKQVNIRWSMSKSQVSFFKKKKAGFTLSALIVNHHFPNVSKIFMVKLGSLYLEVAFHFPDLREMLIKAGE